MSNSPLVDYTEISPNRTSPRKHAIDTITIHCVVGQCAVTTLGHEFAKASKRASSNYGIGYDGKIGMYVEECDRSWCSSNTANDERAITIEVASDTTPPYAVKDAAYKSLIKLLVDICQRNGIKELKWKADKSLIGQPDKQNMTVHRWFANKSCPGDYLYDRHGQIAAEVNAILNPKIETEPADKPAENDTIYRVQAGAYKNKTYAEALYQELKAKGFATYLVQVGSLYKVQVGAYKVKANAEAAAKKLEAAGYKYYITTEAGTSVAVSAKKSIDAMAKEVIQGKWGSGTDRVNRLKKAGYTDDEIKAIQKRVNELM